ncbi:MAG: polyketide cyclase / dehydrase and lipid transport family protein [Actinomycetota bacterium]
MQRHTLTFEVDASPKELWELFWASQRQDLDYEGVKIKILYPGDELGNGLVRTAWFRVPRYLLSGGKAHSWEWITNVKPYESWQYDAVGKPLWSRAHGVTRLEDLGRDRTRLHFEETYHVFNPVMRTLLERRVHRFISRDNDKRIREGIELGAQAIAAMRAQQQG